MPCPIHGELEPLSPLNAHYWQLYVEVVAPFAVRDDLTVRGKRFLNTRRLDFAALQGIAAAYPIGQPRRFFDAMQTIFEILQES